MKRLIRKAIFEDWYEDNKYNIVDRIKSKFPNYDLSTILNDTEKLKALSEAVYNNLDDISIINPNDDIGTIKYKINQLSIEPQTHSSENTSINSTKLPSLFNNKKVDWNDKNYDKSTIKYNIDVGCGKYPQIITEKLKQSGVHNIPIDKNMDIEQLAESNEEIKQILANGGSDYTTCSNVLNVLDKGHIIHDVIEQCYSYLKVGGTSYFTVYEGDGSGQSKETQKGDSWQNQRKTKEYVELVEDVYGNAELKGNLIIAYK